MFEDGLIPEKILGSEYGHRLHFWDLLKRRHLQEIDLGKEYQLNPTHYPRKHELDSVLCFRSRCMTTAVQQH
jgi:selenium binding protein SBP56